MGKYFLSSTEYVYREFNEMNPVIIIIIIIIIIKKNFHVRRMDGVDIGYLGDVSMWWK